MVEVKDISTENKTCKIYRDINGAYIVKFNNDEVSIMSGPFFTEALAEAKGEELKGADHISTETFAPNLVVTSF